VAFQLNVEVCHRVARLLHDRAAVRQISDRDQHVIDEDGVIG